MTEPHQNPWWAFGPHIQTILPAFMQVPLPAYHRERWQTPDDDFVDVDWVNFDRIHLPNQRLVVMFHGLEGSSRSTYCKTMMNECVAQNMSGVVIHWRSCSGEMNSQPCFYHSGFSAEIDWILTKIARQYPHTRRHAVGVSLGGNALLKWLGEQGSAAERMVQSAAAICSPHSLKAGSVALASGFNQMVYMRNFLRTLKKKALQKKIDFPDAPINTQLVRAARNFNELDDAVTAPIHGYLNAHDYWARASSKQFLSAIETRTLVLNSLNDPFVPAQSLARADEVSAKVALKYTHKGGHVGFMHGKTRTRLDWLPQHVLSFLTATERNY